MTAQDAGLTFEGAAQRSGWGSRIRFFQPHNPAFWLYAYLVVSGAHLFYLQVQDYSQYPSVNLLAFALLAIFTLPFVWFITRADRFEREPAKLCLLAFIWGGLVATWVIASPANAAVLSLYGKLISVDFATTWGPASTAPFTEETAKYAGIVMMVLLARPHVRSAYDGMILGAFTGLGFQVFENYSYMVSRVATDFGSRPVEDVISVFFIRAGTGLWSHALYSAIAGAGLGYLLGATNRTMGHRVLVAALFLFAAMFVHGSLDAVAGVGPLVLPVTIIAGTALAVFAWKFSERRQREWVEVLLADDAGTGLVSKDELAVLSGPRKERSRYLKSIKEASGKEAAHAAGLVLDAQVDLAAAIAASDSTESPEAEYARSEVRRLRQAA